MISMDKKYTTRDGRPVRLLCVDGQNKDVPVVGYIGSDLCLSHWYNNGSFIHPDQQSKLDLIEVKNKKSGWVNIWLDGRNHYWVGEIYPTKEKAKELNPDALTTIFIEWEE